MAWPDHAQSRLQALRPRPKGEIPAAMVGAERPGGSTATPEVAEAKPWHRFAPPSVGLPHHPPASPKTACMHFHFTNPFLLTATLLYIPTDHTNPGDGTETNAEDLASDGHIGTFLTQCAQDGE